MTTEDWRRISDIFSDCLNRSSEERELLLADLDRGQPEISREVRSMLQTYDQDQGFLERPAIQHLGVVATETIGAQPLPPEQPRAREPKRASFWVLLAADILALGMFIFVAIVVARHGAVTTNSGWDIDFNQSVWRVQEVESDGPAANKLQEGDGIAAINGSRDKRQMLATLRSTPPGGSYSMRIIRNGAEREFTLVNAIVPNSLGIAGIVAYLAVGFVFFLTAALIGILRPNQWITRLAWAALLTEALTLLAVILRFYGDFLPGPYSLTWRTVQLADGPHFALAYHFYSRAFSGNAKRWRFPLVALYAWGGLVALHRPVIETLSGEFFLATHFSLWRLLTVVVGPFYLVAPLAVCVAVVRSYVTAKEPAQRRRARWIAFGSLAGILPYTIVRSVAILPAYKSRLPEGYEILLALAILPAMLIPIATGYAILKHRLFDIHVVLRRGVQYLLAKSVLQLILALPVLGLGYALITNANRTLGDMLLHNGIFVSLLVLIALVLKFREPVRSWLDRRFFRERYQQERLLVGLIDSVKHLRSVFDMAGRVGRELVAVLHPESVFVFYHEPESRAFIPGFSTDGRADGVRIPDGSLVTSALLRDENPQDLTSLRRIFGGVRNWGWLDRWGIDLMVPLNGSDGSLAGFILLGRKKSEEPYTPSDRKLLRVLADQMAIVCENMSLQERLQEQRKTSQQLRDRVEGQGIRWLRHCPRCRRCFDSSSRTCSQDQNELVMSWPVQQVVDGRYRLERVIAQGGMGVVFEASDLRLARNVALKLLLAGQLGDQALLKRFGREARALARLNHPNIVGTYDFGVAEGEASYLVMELVSGSTLRAEMKQGGIQPSLLANWIDQILEGAKAAHAAGIVHRDLKPENVLISSAADGKRLVKIADFGIAKWSLAEQKETSSLTMPGTVLGSLQYMSPEQLTGQPVDQRSDIFSIGAMVFEILAGRLPFKGNTVTERIVSVLQDSPGLDVVFPGAPALQAALAKCLDKDPARRFASAADLQAELVPLIAKFAVPASRTTEGNSGKSGPLR
jgi:tRNA A-37 threonylcarbamoyl transferase component Bud32